MSDPAVARVALADVDPIDLPGGSWSRMLITDASVEGNASSLGYSIFAPGSVVGPVAHEVEEVAYVVSGTGELRLDDGPFPFGAGQAVTNLLGGRIEAAVQLPAAQTRMPRRRVPTAARRTTPLLPEVRRAAIRAIGAGSVRPRIGALQAARS